MKQKSNESNQNPKETHKTQKQSPCNSLNSETKKKRSFNIPRVAFPEYFSYTFHTKTKNEHTWRKQGHLGHTIT